MPENDFEKKVQDKMDEFQLSPSAGLWNKVESRIRKEKKRRIIFWWPLAILLVGSGIGLAIWLTKNSSVKPSTPIAETQPVKTGLNETNEKDATGITAKGSPVSNLNNEETRILEKKEKISGITEPGKNNLLIKTNAKPVSITNKVAKKQSHLPQSKNQDEYKKELPEKLKELAELKTKLPEPGKVNPGIAEEPTEEKKLTGPLKEKVSETGDEAKPPTMTKTNKIQQSKQWGLGISGGGSAIVYNLGLGGNREFMALPSSTPAQLSTYRRPGTQRSFSFSVQAFWKQRLSPRLNVIGTLGYQYLSTRLVTGERVDSSTFINNYYSPNMRVGRFYRAPGYGSTGNYTNQFHFLSLGAELSWRFTGEKTNLGWNNGLSYDRLFSSSMLHYDGIIQGFYKDNKRLRKNHVFFNTSLSIPVGKKLELHPFASHSLTSVFNSRDSATSKYSNFGLRIRYLFDKRK